MQFLEIKMASGLAWQPAPACLLSLCYCLFASCYSFCYFFGNSAFNGHFLHAAGIFLLFTGNELGVHPFAAAKERLRSAPHAWLSTTAECQIIATQSFLAFCQKAKTNPTGDCVVIAKD
jgi:hypothetical protein